MDAVTTAPFDTLYDRSQFVNVTELATALGRSVPWVYQKVKAGQIPLASYKLGRTALWPVDVIEKVRGAMRVPTDVFPYTPPPAPPTA